MRAKHDMQIRDLQRVATILRPIYPDADEVELVPDIMVTRDDADRHSPCFTITISITISDDRMTREEIETAAARVNVWAIQQIGRDVEFSADVAEKSATLRLRVIG